TRFGTRIYVPASKESTDVEPEEESFPELEDPLGEEPDETEPAEEPVEESEETEDKEG
ncbi:MAG: hypothetical protein GWN14_08370, partial [candidate division Zixibacteria bacterium]|nr:hypothetical protein [Gammaproteobacteria bacterium]NIX55925.1 hypothetical protein [candidate division Zixibacteria bacterium]